MPTDYDFEDFKSIYLYAYDKGLKGCTTFRFNPEAFQGVLVTEKDLENTTYKFTLDDGTDVGQIKIIYAKTEPAGSYSANINVDSWGYSSTSGTEIVLDSQGEAVICIWDGSLWYPISVFGATVQ